MLLDNEWRVMRALREARQRLGTDATGEKIACQLVRYAVDVDRPMPKGDGPIEWGNSWPDWVHSDGKRLAAYKQRQIDEAVRPQVGRLKRERADEE